MRITEIISRKKSGIELGEAELSFLLNTYLSGQTPDYQMASWLMAVYFRGMTSNERSIWTKLMWKSGTTFEREKKNDFWVDKHSTGGVGDKTSLILVPLVSAVAERVIGKGKVKLPMVSGRGLGHTGGTLDKLESVTGFNTQLTQKESLELLEKNGFFMIGQTDEIAPADKRIYALRDATATVDSIPLIVSSILSKKLAENLDGIVFDVKVGSGAFMADLSSAKELARGLVETISIEKVKATALLTDMNQPLGKMVGHFLEVEECWDFINGQQDSRLKELVLELATEMLFLAAPQKMNREQWKTEVQADLCSERTQILFREMFENQKGNWRKFEQERNHLPQNHFEYVYKSPSDGFLESCDPKKIAQLVSRLGGGRGQLTDPINHRVGVQLEVPIGERVRVNQVIAKMIVSNSESANELCHELSSCFVISNVQPPIQPIIFEVIK
jgi:pyrimidine-nucleoside phosphorylase